jgi:amino acid permease
MLVLFCQGLQATVNETYRRGVVKRSKVSIKVIYFIALFFVAVALGPALAHLLELPNKINLTREEYLTVQQIYRGWALLGIVVAGALLSTLVLTVVVRHKRKAFVFALIAFICIVGTQIVFWTYTYPANQTTNNWTMLPENWRELRQQWEYSHAASAGLNLLALLAMIFSVLAREAKSAVNHAGSLHEGDGEKAVLR